MRNLIIVLLASLVGTFSLIVHALPDKLPDDLVWQTNLSDPIFADSNAKRGGRFRSFVTTFPLTLRLVGPDSNGSFASYMRANNLSLVGIHPNTLKPIPELATEWALGSDGHTIYFHLDPDARWSDGTPVTADDYVFGLELNIFWRRGITTTLTRSSLVWLNTMTTP
jgi:microcin C transport system substrate-binding protein